LRACYDDRLFPAPGSTSCDGPSKAEKAASSDAAPSSSSAAAAAAAASSVAGINFQQKIEVAPLAQLTAMGDVAGDGQHQDDGSQGQFAAGDRDWMA